jgi:cell division protein FtsB
MPYKKIAFFVIMLIGFLTINNLAHSIYVIWQKQDLITKAQQNLDAVKAENQKLKHDISQVNQPQFIETQARDNLSLAKPNEAVVVIPTGTVLGKQVTHPLTDTQPNWQKWWDYFFKS